jgi:hypothetical protein
LHDKIGLSTRGLSWGGIWIKITISYFKFKCPCI